MLIPFLSLKESDYFSYIETPKAIVFVPALLDAFKICREPNCGSYVEKENMKCKTVGASISIECLCNNNHFRVWNSSPVVGTGKEAIAVINILLATFCLTVGLHVNQVLDFFAHLRVYCFGKSFYFNLQKRVLEKVVWMQWQLNQKNWLDEAKKNLKKGISVSLAGDGKYDSPGFSASYCTYIVQDLYTQAIVGLYVAHKNQVHSSSEMEPFAVKTLLLNLMHEHKLKIYSITTDRSSSVKTAISELQSELPEGFEAPLHFFDIWHYIKSILKDLWAACKLKTCKDLIPWIPSITNMLWYSFSSSIGNLTKLQEMILSIPDHISNVHKFGDNKIHKACEHPDLSSENRTKLWLFENHLGLKKLRQFIFGRDGSRFKDLQHMLGFTHTGLIESFNALHNKYANKNFFYQPSGMCIRAALAALDWNCNLKREQAKSETGKLRFNLVSNRAGSKWLVLVIVLKIMYTQIIIGLSNPSWKVRIIRGEMLLQSLL